MLYLSDVRVGDVFVFDGERVGYVTALNPESDHCVFTAIWDWEVPGEFAEQEATITRMRVIGNIKDGIVYDKPR